MIEGTGGPGHATVAVAFVEGLVAAYVPTLASLRRAAPDLTVAVATTGGDLGPLAGPGVASIAAPSLAAAVNQVLADGPAHVVVIADSALLPPAALERARPLVGDHLHVATVSFFSNLGGPLSFPERNQGGSHQVGSLDEEAITRRLRDTGPDLGPAVVPFAAGPVVVLSAYALSAVGPLDETPGLRPAAVLADFSLRARRKGFVDVVDPTTFCARPFDLAPVVDPWPSPEERRWLAARHPAFTVLADDETRATSSGLAAAHTTARAKVLGLRVLVDGSCLGPKEMGTQVQTISLVGALARRPDVDRVTLALGGEVPGYAATVASHPKVVVRRVPAGDVSGLGPFEVAHRPFQPDGPLHPSWAAVAARSVLTIQDLIAFHGAAYHADPASWQAHRRALRQAVAAADGVVVISADTAARLELEGLPVEGERVFLVPNGTDHLHGGEAEALPGELLARGGVAGDFALVLGTNYDHKNRDLALAAVGELRRRGRPLTLVMAGAAVPFGSSRVGEAVAGTGPARAADVVVLPDVTSEERNWLLRHASVLLYPTSAEGFGLVPYEAARFGTPTVLVPFGPLGEVAGDLPVVAPDWSPSALAGAVAALLDDPALAAAQVGAARAAGRDFTWDATAAKLVAAYRGLLSRPPRRGREVAWL